MNNVSETETSLDVLGYYMHLPETFIYNDPLMENRNSKNNNKTYYRNDYFSKPNPYRWSTKH